MRKRLLASLGALLTSASMALSQAPVPLAITEQITAPAENGNGHVLAEDSHAPFPCCCCQGSVSDGSGKGGPQVWGSAEYLLWWLKSSPLTTPLVTVATNPATVGAGPGGSGALNDPDTFPLIAGPSYNPGVRSGGRFTLGGWVDDDHRIGVEGS